MYCILLLALAKYGAAWNINILGQKMATEALKDQEYLSKITKMNAAERVKVTEGLKALGCTVYESQTNFILFKVPEIENTEVTAALAQDKVLIGSPIGMNRVSLGTAEMNDKFLSLMGLILESCKKKLA